MGGDAEATPRTPPAKRRLTPPFERAVRLGTCSVLTFVACILSRHKGCRPAKPPNSFHHAELRCSRGLKCRARGHDRHLHPLRCRPNALANVRAGGRLRLSFPCRSSAKTDEASPSLRRKLLRYAHTVMIQTSDTALALGHYTVNQRLARWILMGHDRARWK